MVIEVAFKGNRREFFEWPFPDPPALKTPVIVEVERGEDMGRVHATGELALKRRAGTTHGKATRNPLRRAIRVASSHDVSRAAQLRADEQNVRVRAIEKARSLGLDLKISDTEWQWDKKRLTVYFTAEQRVDFRQFVRQLEGLFGTRVHMWHIGVRDEAKRLDGVGRCGRQLCSAGWLPELVPVKSSVAKDQNLSTLNPSQISGACGRLMCCLRYEHEFYVEQRRRFPKEGKLVRTAAGEEKVLAIDIFRETVTLRSVAGETRVVALQRLREELVGELPAWATRTGRGPAGVEEDKADADDAAAENAGTAETAEAAGVADGDEVAEAEEVAEAAEVADNAPGAEGAPSFRTGPSGAPAGPGLFVPPDNKAGGSTQPGSGRRRRRGRRGGRRSRGSQSNRPGPGPSEQPGPQVTPPNPRPAGHSGPPEPGNMPDGMSA